MNRMIMAAALVALAGCSARSTTQPFIPMAATETTFAAEMYPALVYDPLGGPGARYQALVLSAEEHCRRYGKTARLVSDTEGEYTRRRVAFECR